MSNNSRPYRATIAGPLRTTHYDYPSKEERGSWRHTSAKHTTVTSRKPLKPGTPVCWVNVYEDSDGKRAGGFTHRTKGAAALSAGSAAIHCIPVYLPGEGAAESTYVQAWRVLLGKSVSAGKTTDEVISLAYERYVDRAEERIALRQERDAAKAEVALLVRERDSLLSQRDAAQTEVYRLTGERDALLLVNDQLRMQREAAQARRDEWQAEAEHLRAEVERLTEERDTALAQRDAAESALASAHESLADTHRLRVDLASAQAQAMPAEELASLRKVYAKAFAVREWFDPPKHVQNALIFAVHDHAEKFGKPQEPTK